jgi:DNA modification methylase
VLLPLAIDKYHIQDARDLASLLPTATECIDVTITSPPYWNIKDYGTQGQIGFGQSYSKYLDDIESVFATVYSATKRTGSLWLVSDTLKTNGELQLLPFDIAQRLRRSGWLLQDIIIWQKDRTLPWSHQGKLRNIFEYIACYSKTRRFKYHVDNVREIFDLKDYWIRYPERYNPDGKAPSRTWQIPIPRQGSWGEAENYVRHACPLPIELIDRILRLATDPGDVVLDPFAGSGAVLATANALGRHFIGVDLSANYQAMFSRRVLPAVRKRHLSTNTASHDGKVKQRFAETILALRALKLPKELIRLYRKTHGRFDCRSVWVVAERGSRKIKLLFDFQRKQQQPPNFLARASALCKVKPLSKYGLEIDLHATHGKNLLPRLLSNLGLSGQSRICTYTDGRFFSWQRHSSIRRVLAELADSQAGGIGQYPPLHSRLKVQVDPRYPERFFRQETDA